MEDSTVLRTALAAIFARDRAPSRPLPPAARDPVIEAASAAEHDHVSAVLLELGCPPPGALRGSQRRAPDTIKEAARKLRVYLRAAYGPRYCIGDFQHALRLYLRFCRLDHREPASPNHVIGALLNLPGINRREEEDTCAETGRRTWTRRYYVGKPPPRGKRKRRRRKRPKRQETAIRQATQHPVQKPAPLPLAA